MKRTWAARVLEQPPAEALLVEHPRGLALGEATRLGRERRQEQARRDRLEEQVAGDLVPPQGRMRHVVGRARGRARLDHGRLFRVDAVRRGGGLHLHQ